MHKFGRAVIDVVHQGLVFTNWPPNFDATQSELKFPFEQVIHVQDISFRYPTSEVNVLSGACLDIKKARSLVLSGKVGLVKVRLWICCLDYCAHKKERF